MCVFVCMQVCMYVLLKQEKNNHLIPDSDSQGRKAGRQERGARGFT